MPLFGLTVTFDLHPGRTDDFLPLVRANAATSLRDEPGCLRFDVLVPEGRNHESVFLYEVYTDTDAFIGHLATSHFRTFDAAIKDMVVHKDARRFILLDPFGPVCV